MPQLKSPQFPTYFAEVQFQKDPDFYHRFFAQLFLYLRLYRVRHRWQAIVIFPRRSLEPKNLAPFEVLLNSEQVTKFYLNEIDSQEPLPLGIATMKLVLESKRRTARVVRELVECTKQEIGDSQKQQDMLELIKTIVLYKMLLISRQEFGRMFSTFDIKRTRYYQELKQELREEIRPEIRDELRPEIRDELLTELMIRQLRHRFPAITATEETQVQQLSTHQLENLAEALLDFRELNDVIEWLTTQLSP